MSPGPDPSGTGRHFSRAKSGASPDGGEDARRPGRADDDAPRSQPAGDEEGPLNESRLPEELEVQDVAAPAAEEVVPAEDASNYQDRWLRAEAELQNFRRRSAREMEESRRHAEEAVMLDLISLLDDLERGIQAARAGGAADAWLQGIELVAARMRDTLARRGVEVVDPVGQPFDPGQHEALLEVPAVQGMKPGDVAQVVLKGYRRGARALRAARVVVARAPAEGEG
jgi:molecular chaperone GrpE